MKKSQEKERVNIYVPVYFREPFVRRCLETAIPLAETEHYDVQFILIDNKSDDSLRRYLKSLSREHDNVKTWLLDRNVGKASAIQKAVKKYRDFEWFVNMDSDIVMRTPNWVEIMVESFKAISNAGMVSLSYTDNGNNPMPKQPSKEWVSIEPDERKVAFRYGAAVAGGCFVTSNWVWAHTGYRNTGTYGGVDGIFRQKVSDILKKKCGWIDVVVGEHLNDKIDYPEYFAWKIGVQQNLREKGFYSDTKSIGNDRGFWD